MNGLPGIPAARQKLHFKPGLPQENAPLPMRPWVYPASRSKERHCDGFGNPLDYPENL